MMSSKDTSAYDVMQRLDSRGLLEVAKAVSSVEGVPVELLLGRVRSSSISKARKRLYLELRRRGLSFPEIGQLLGRDHTTIMSGLRAGKRTPAPEPIQFRVAS